MDLLIHDFLSQEYFHIRTDFFKSVEATAVLLNFSGLESKAVAEWGDCVGLAKSICSTSHHQWGQLCEHTAIHSLTET